jgi:hypothetical protein
MKKVLVIHPEDRSTKFLEKIYSNIPNVTIVTKGKTKDEIHQLITEHDRIIMMGHGSPNGLFSVGQFKNTNGFVIDKDVVPFLEGKENICIWCNADMFVRKYGVKGFFSGMFISEVGEAWACGVPDQSQTNVDLSNYTFTDLVTENINDDLGTIHKNVTKGYGELAKISKIAEYNNQRLYLVD